MGPGADLRPMRPSDVPAVDAMALRVLFQPIAGEDVTPPEDLRHRRLAHLVATDPAGCWVAVAGEEVVGVALALRREGLWGLSLFAVAPEHQERGIGRALLDAALAHADGTEGAIIMSSTHPGAMRRYARAGFRLLPAVGAAGVLHRARLPAADPRVADPGPGADERIGAIGRAVRGASYAVDLPALRATGHTVLALEDRGFCVRNAGIVKLLAAHDEDAARRLLRTALAGAGAGTTASVDVITAGNDWAIEVALEAGLALSPDGPLFVRGTVGPLQPFLPSGAYL